MDWVSKVDGSMLGKSFTTTGSRNSMKGTTMKTRKGTRRKRSAQMRRNCKGRRSQRSRHPACRPEAPGHGTHRNSRAVPLGRACRRAGWDQHPVLGPPGPWGPALGKQLRQTQCCPQAGLAGREQPEDGSLLGRLWPHPHPQGRACLWFFRKGLD